MQYAKKVMLQEQSLFYSDVNLSEAAEYSYLPKLENLFKSHPDAVKLRGVVKEAESFIKEKGELSEVERKTGWQIVIRYFQIVQDLNTITCIVLCLQIMPLILNLWYRLIRYWADSAEIKNEIKYAEQAIAQLKKIEKKASGKDKERIHEYIVKLEKTIKEVQ